MKLFVKGDLEGFFALGLDTMLVLILMGSLCMGLLGFSGELFYGRILPASAVGLLIGNLFYAYKAYQLAERENRTDVCAIPYGTSILAVIVFVFLVMYPVQQQALSDGLSKAEADVIAWSAGIIACAGSGLIEFFGAFFAHHLRRFTPRAALLSAIAGIGLMFISLDFVFRAYAYPIIGLSTLALFFVFFFGRMKSRLKLPGGFVVLAFGTVLAWVLYAFGFPSVVPFGEIKPEYLGLHLPYPALDQLIQSWGYMLELLPIFLPIGFIFLIGSLQNIESAAASGDDYEAKPLLLANGLGSLGAAFFGSPFSTSIYLGHPGYKRMGARAGYSTLNAVIWSLVCFTGTLSYFVYFIPIEAGMAILIWIGVVMCAQAFEATEKRHAPAVVVGLLPAIAAYVALAVKHAMSVAGQHSSEPVFNESINDAFVMTRSFYSDGMFALAQGYLFTCLVLAATTVCIIDRKFKQAGWWLMFGAALSSVGLIHSYAFVSGDVIGQLSLVPELSKWTLGYLLMAFIVFVTPLVAVAAEDVTSDEQPESDAESDAEGQGDINSQCEVT